MIKQLLTGLFILLYITAPAQSKKEIRDMSFDGSPNTIVITLDEDNAWRQIAKALKLQGIRGEYDSDIGIISTDPIKTDISLFYSYTHQIIINCDGNQCTVNAIIANGRKSEGVARSSYSGATFRNTIWLLKDFINNMEFTNT